MAEKLKKGVPVIIRRPHMTPDFGRAIELDENAGTVKVEIAYENKWGDTTISTQDIPEKQVTVPWFLRLLK